jgi:hypothetical protein
MGNAIAKRFDLPKEHTATAGHVNNWRIWPGELSDTLPCLSPSYKLTVTFYSYIHRSVKLGEQLLLHDTIK